MHLISVSGPWEKLDSTDKSSMQVKLKLHYETDLGPHVVPFIEAKKVPRKGDVLEVGGVMVEALHVIKTPFSKYQAAIVTVKALEFFVR